MSKAQIKAVAKCVRALRRLESDELVDAVAILCKVLIEQPQMFTAKT